MAGQLRPVLRPKMVAGKPSGTRMPFCGTDINPGWFDSVAGSKELLNGTRGLFVSNSRQ